MLIKNDPQLRIRVITFNIRYAATDLERGEQPWPQRCPLIIAQLRHELRGFTSATNAQSSTACSTAAIICLQEALHHQLLDVVSGLNQGQADQISQAQWTFFGVGRDDGKTSGEYNPILYHPNSFKLQVSRTLWLSPTPLVPSRGWDAGCNRILCLALFQHRPSMRDILVANTHLDNVGYMSRKHSAEMILQWLDEFVQDHKRVTQGIVLTGDFNSRPDETAYIRFKLDGTFSDVFTLAETRDKYGEFETYTGFGPDTAKEEQGRIDFVWCGPNARDAAATSSCYGRPDSPWEVQGYAVLPNKFHKSTFSSDHCAVVADLLLK